jgi:hypothetical protein
MGRKAFLLLKLFAGLLQVLNIMGFPIVEFFQAERMKFLL